MLNREIAADIIRYAQGLSRICVETINTGFLAYEMRNHIEKSVALDISNQAQTIISEMVSQFTRAEVTPDKSECGLLYQYVFDKVAEVTYKTLVGEEVDTTMDIKEAFEYHEPDLPIYIQEKLTSVVHKLALISSRTLRFIDEKGYRTDDLENWFFPYLLIPVGFAIQFVVEMDLDDDSDF